MHTLSRLWPALLVPTLIAATPGTRPHIEIEDAIALEGRELPARGRVSLTLPSLPAKPGKIVVLRVRLVSWAERFGGCNYNASLRLNGMPIGRYTAGDDAREIKHPDPVERAGGIVLIFGRSRQGSPPRAATSRRGMTSRHRW